MTEVDVTTAAERLGVSERTVRRWLREGRLAGYKVGGRIRIPERALREAATPYGSDASSAATDAAHAADEATREPSAAPDERARLLALLDDPVMKAAALRRRRELASAVMDEIAARSRPSTGPDDTVEAYIREDRAERDLHWDELLGLDRP
jgi:excisionase family DNA binding protein